MSDRALLRDALPNRSISILLWACVAALGAFAFAGITLNRNEPVSAAWLVTAAICVYLIAYRFYGRFIAQKVLKLVWQRAAGAQQAGEMPTIGFPGANAATSAREP
jgi:predicted membrane channel-forming protein YqfA (hemolysin III family)